MTSSEANGHADQETVGTAQAAAGADPDSGHEHTDEAHTDELHTNEALTVAATVGVVAVGAALFEVALLPGIALGVAAMLAPKYVPKVGSAVTPMFRSSVRGIYKFGQKSREMMAEAKEQVSDIVAEVHAEKETPKTASAEAPRA